MTTDRINSAYSRCGSKGTLLTVEKLTDLPVNYLITVNFHGFKEVVDKLGGVWMDVDRRYYNRNTGSAYNNFANIDLQPGYQRLDGQQALDFVRYRHTDSDLYRVARQQEFVRAFREQVGANFSPFSVPSLVNAITRNIEVAEGGRKLQGKQVYNYALFAYGLPSGHLFQDKIENVVCGLGCQASTDDIQKAVQTFSNPDVESSKAANAAALGQKIKTKAPPPSSVTVTVLNGSGISAAAADTSYVLGQRGYRTLIPPNNLKADAPSPVFHSKIYYDPAQKRSKAAATALQNLMQPAEVAKLPRTPGLLALDPGSMLVVVLGTAFHGLAEAPQQVVPKHQPAYVRYDQSQGAPLLEPNVKKVNFPLLNPTVLERSSYPDTLSGDKPVRRYFISGKHKAVRLVFKTAGNEFWGIQETDWTGAPGAQRPKLPAQPRRSRVRPLLLGFEAPHGRPAPRRCDVLGGQHLARLALERDDAGDRQGSQTANNRKVGSAPMGNSSKIGIFGAGWVGLVTGACFAELGHEVVIRDVVPEKIVDAPARRGAVP